MKYILWNRKRDGQFPPLDENGEEIISDGAIGRVDAENVYLKTYARFRPESKKLDELVRGERIKDVVFSLCGERAKYDVIRVE